MSNKIYIPYFISDSDFTPNTSDPRVMFYNGKVDCDQFYIETTGATYTAITSYPYFDYYSGNISTSNSDSLLFFNEDATFGTKPTDSLYSKYWEKYITLLYNPTTRLFTCNAVIPISRYNNLNLNDIVQFKGNHYHLRSINSYNLNTGECEVQLLGPILFDAMDYHLNPDAYELELPIVAMNVDSITSTSAIFNGYITDFGSEPVQYYGFYYNTGSTVSDTNYVDKLEVSGTTTSFTSGVITGLTANSDYSVIGFGGNEYGFGISDITHFNTNDITYTINLLVDNTSNYDATYNWLVRVSGTTVSLGETYLPSGTTSSASLVYIGYNEPLSVHLDCSEITIDTIKLYENGLECVGVIGGSTPITFITSNYSETGLSVDGDLTITNDTGETEFNLFGVIMNL